MTLIHSDIDDIQKNEFKVEYTQGSWQLKNLFSKLLKKIPVILRENLLYCVPIKKSSFKYVFCSSVYIIMHATSNQETRGLVFCAAPSENNRPIDQIM